jgi:hypothetical protein
MARYCNWQERQHRRDSFQKGLLRHDLWKRRPASRNHRRPFGTSHSWIFVPHGAMIIAATGVTLGRDNWSLGVKNGTVVLVPRQADLGARIWIRNENAIK